MLLQDLDSSRAREDLLIVAGKPPDTRRRAQRAHTPDSDDEAFANEPVAPPAGDLRR